MAPKKTRNTHNGEVHETSTALRSPHLRRMFSKNAMDGFYLTRGAMEHSDFKNKQLTLCGRSTAMGAPQEGSLHNKEP